MEVAAPIVTCTFWGTGEGWGGSIEATGEILSRQRDRYTAPIRATARGTPFNSFSRSFRCIIPLSVASMWLIIPGGGRESLLKFQWAFLSLNGLGLIARR